MEAQTVGDFGDFSQFRIYEKVEEKENSVDRRITSATRGVNVTKSSNRKITNVTKVSGDSSSSSISLGSTSSPSTSDIPEADGSRKLSGIERGFYENILHSESVIFVREKALQMSQSCEKITKFIPSKIGLSMVQGSNIQDACNLFVGEFNLLLSTFGLSKILVEKKTEKDSFKKKSLSKSSSLDQKSEVSLELTSKIEGCCKTIMQHCDDLMTNTDDMVLCDKVIQEIKSKSSELVDGIQQIFMTTAFNINVVESDVKPTGKFTLFPQKNSYITWVCQFKTAMANHVWSKCKEKVNRFFQENVLIDIGKFLESIENRKTLNKLFKAKKWINEIVEKTDEERTRAECDLMASYWDGLHDFTDMLKNFKGENALLQELIEEFVCAINNKSLNLDPKLIKDLEKEAREVKDIKKFSKFLQAKTTLQKKKRFAEVPKKELANLFGRIKRAMLVKELYAVIKKETSDESIVSSILEQISRQVQIQYIDRIIEVELQKRVSQSLEKRKKEGTTVMYRYDELIPYQVNQLSNLRSKAIMVEWTRGFSGGYLNYKSKDGKMNKTPFKAASSLPVATPDEILANQKQNEEIYQQNARGINTFVKGDGVNNFGLEGTWSEYCFKDKTKMFVKDFREQLERVLTRIIRPKQTFSADQSSSSVSDFDKMVEEFNRLLAEASPQSKDSSGDKPVLKTHEMLFIAFETLFKDQQALEMPEVKELLRVFNSSLFHKYPEVMKNFDFLKVKNILSIFYRSLHQSLSGGALTVFNQNYKYVFSRDKDGIKSINDWDDDKVTQITTILDSDHVEIEWLKRRELGFSSWLFNQDLQIGVSFNDPVPKPEDSSLLFFYEKTEIPTGKPELRFKEVEGKRCLRRAALVLNSMGYPSERFLLKAQQ